VKALTIEQVADILQMSTRTVYRYLKSGKLPGTKIGGAPNGQWRILDEDLKAVIRGQDVRMQKGGEDYLRERC